MKTMLCMAIALLTSGMTQASEIGWAISGGSGIASREYSDDPPFDQLTPKYEGGQALKIQATLRGEPGWMARARFNYTVYDRLTAMGFVIVEEDMNSRDSQLGMFYAPVIPGIFGYRLGGGYEYLNEESLVQDGPFVEVALLINAGSYLSFDTGAAFMPLRADDSAYDKKTRRTELHLDTLFHVGAIDLALGGRYGIDRVVEHFTSFGTPIEQEHEEKLLEISLTVAAKWGYPTRK